MASRLAILFGTHQVGVSLPTTDETVRAACNEDFGGATSAVVIGTHRHPIGSGAESGHEVPASHLREASIFGQKVPGFAHRTDNILRERVRNRRLIVLRRGRHSPAWSNRPDTMEGVVQRGAN